MYIYKHLNNLPVLWTLHLEYKFNMRDELEFIFVVQILTTPIHHIIGKNT